MRLRTCTARRPPAHPATLSGVCARSPLAHTPRAALRAVYAVVLKKEAEKRAKRSTAPEPPEDSFAAQLKQQWEERKKELAAQQLQGEAR